MFTDIVSYDSLLKEDEKKAFDARKKNQRIHKRLIKKFNGRWLKEMESGTLASFSSVIDAVMCALSIQKTTEELEIPLRMGIHQGDVIFEKKDILGDGVNIASRIHSLIDTHGIVISDTVYKDIKNKEGLEIESLGIQTLKGVDAPVSIYKVSCQDESVLDFTVDTGELVKPISFTRSTIIIGIIVIALLSFAIYYFIPKATPSSESKKRVLILPPGNYLGTDTLDYLMAGMHDALIGDMGKIGALNVISRTSAVAYKKEGKSVLQMASEYNIDYIVESSVLCYEDSVCTQFRVFDEHENELSVQDISVEKSQILNLYSTVTKEISSEIGVILTPVEERRLAVTRTVDKEVYDLYLKSHMYLDKLEEDALDKAREFLTYAIEKDPNWAPLYAGLASVWVAIGQMGHESPEVVRVNVYENINKALELDPDHAESHRINASVAFSIEWNWEKVEKELLTVIELSPNDALAHINYAHLLMIQERHDEALLQGKLAIDLDPLDPWIQVAYSIVLRRAGQLQLAYDYIEKVLITDPGNFFALRNMEITARYLGDSLRSIEAGLQRLPLGDEIKTVIKQIYEEKGYTAAQNEIINELEEYSKENYWRPVDLAMRYPWVNNIEKTLDLLEKGYETHDQWMPYIVGWKRNESIRNHPRYITLLKKMNLPVD
jgi:TolB-like protein/tetratricopeptide (TPR) repeat protein